MGTGPPSRRWVCQPLHAELTATAISTRDDRDQANDRGQGRRQSTNTHIGCHGKGPKENILAPESWLPTYPALQPSWQPSSKAGNHGGTRGLMPLTSSKERGKLHRLVPKAHARSKGTCAPTSPSHAHHTTLTWGGLPWPWGGPCPLGHCLGLSAAEATSQLRGCNPLKVIMMLHTNQPTALQQGL